MNYNTEVKVDRIESLYEYEECKVFDVNGTNYLAGRDEYGYISIESGEVYELEDETVYEAFEDGHHAVNLSNEIVEYINSLV